MALHSLAGKPAPASLLTNIPRLVASYYVETPNPADPLERVAFGTSGHRGSAFDRRFNENHIAAISQATAEYRQINGIDGPLFIGMDTHALSEAAMITALEVLAANGVTLMIDENDGYTPTPVISHAILTHNRAGKGGKADGIVITPSHNPPRDGGFKYNPPSGGPADGETTKWIEDRANEILEAGMADIQRVNYAKAKSLSTTHHHDYITPYVQDLANVIDMQAIAEAGLKIGVDPMGGAGIAYWEPIAEMYGLNMEIVNDRIDPAFAFMTVDKDGLIRMDCSSPYAMASLIDLKDRFDISFGNDPDFDRHGIVTKGGLMNPNHYLAVAIGYLFENRPNWSPSVAIGKTLVSSSMIDRVAEKIGRKLIEVPVGFKWFVPGLLTGEMGFGGEESAGASFLRHDGTVWSTDKDGIIMDLLAAEITARTGKDPQQHYDDLAAEFGSPLYARTSAPASLAEKAKLKQLSPGDISADSLAGEPITAKMSHAPGNNAAIGGLKVTTENGWFAARPSGTEDIYKIYAESFKGVDHLAAIQEEAQAIVKAAL